MILMATEFLIADQMANSVEHIVVAAGVSPAAMQFFGRKRIQEDHQKSLDLVEIEYILSLPYGGVPEWSKGTDCKSVGEAFGGSNPPPSI